MAEHRSIVLAPKGYDPKQIQLSNLDYRIRKYGEHPLMREWREKVLQRVDHPCTPTDFELAP